MVYAPDSGRLRSLFARPFTRHRRIRTYRLPGEIGDPPQRLEPSFDPLPQSFTPRREQQFRAVERDLDPDPVAGRSGPPRAEAAVKTRTWSATRYGMPGACTSEVFGPYARSAEAELGGEVEDEDETGGTDADAPIAERSSGIVLTPAMMPPPIPRTSTADAPDDALIVRLGEALRAIAPDPEKNSAGVFPIVAAQSAVRRPRDRASPPDGEKEEAEHDESIASGTSTGSSREHTAATAGRIPPA